MSEARSLDHLIRTCAAQPSTCEACGRSFECGAATGSCWCAEIELSEEVRAELRLKYERCLCRACLESLAAPRDQRLEPGQRGL